jgi:hypothetical protein
MSQIQPQPHPTAGIIPNKGEDYHTLDKTGAGTYVSSENEHNGSPVLANEPEEVVQIKRQWFQYIKTKQFWITLLLGQGMYTFQRLIENVLTA